ncbi:hypothetical protein D9756_005001 [Leucocoprinus leucothites]|uniref:DNA-directed DNA polymerase X domain-containing protein n=1 Tax=Leucocoprinus leucothites TaxID=201217 RepID=A0A8H5LKW8_9AGAR|nr:hypothetical protein D9756_005001 [Leucoagaricus leucothites]
MFNQYQRRFLISRLHKVGQTVSSSRFYSPKASRKTSIPNDQSDTREDGPKAVGTGRYRSSIESRSSVSLLGPRKANHPDNQRLVDLFIEINNTEFKSGMVTNRTHKTNEMLVSHIATAREPFTSAMDLFHGFGYHFYNRFSYFTEKLHELALAGEIAFNPKELELFKALSEMPYMGPRRVHSLVAAGLQSTTDLLKPEFAKHLTISQRLELKFGNQLSKATPLQAAHEVLEFCRQNTDASYKWFLAGHHRRSVESSDLSLLVLHPSYTEVPEPLPPHKILRRQLDPKYSSFFDSNVDLAKTSHVFNVLQAQLMPELQQQGFIADSRRRRNRLWDGVIRLPGSGAEKDVSSRIQAIQNGQGEYRNLQIRIVAEKALGAALLYYTGDTNFWKWMKSKALEKNLFLSNDGLWRWVTEDSDPVAPLSKLTKKSKGRWECVASQTEEDIFAALQVDKFIRPENRNYDGWSHSNWYHNKHRTAGLSAESS